jgi:alpha-tubulin suppressor-like RCC1 family protein
VVKCWGRNDYGQLGNNTVIDNSPTPVDPIGLSSGVSAIAAGRYHVCVALTAGGAKCWGGNLYGEQGNGVMGNGEHSPVSVNNLTSLTATAVGAGDSTSCLVISNGTLRCWGRDYDGELGNGMSGFNTDQSVPVSVSNVSSGATAISNGYGFTCGVVSGSAKCWGSNGYYGLGVGQNASFTSNVPAQVTGLTSGVSAIAATSSDHACVVTTAGAVKCWGSGSGGHLGAGNEDDALTPVSVLSLP